MSRLNFLNRVRMGRHMAAQTRTHGRAPVWLHPATVRDYRPDEFPDLSDADRQGLTDAVRAFERLAAAADPTPTADQLRDGEAALDGVAARLARYEPRRDEMAPVRAALNTVAWPDWVANWYCVRDSDPYSGPLARVAVILADGRLPKAEYGRAILDLFGWCLEAMEDAGLPHLPAVNFRTIADYQSGMGLVNAAA